MVGLHERITKELQLLVAVCSDTTLSCTHRIEMLPSCKRLREFRDTLRVLESVLFKETHVRNDSAWCAFDVAINNLVRLAIKRVPPPTITHNVYANFVSCFSVYACALCRALSTMRAKKLEEIK